MSRTVAETHRDLTPNLHNLLFLESSAENVQCLSGGLEVLIKLCLSSTGLLFGNFNAAM